MALYRYVKKQPNILIQQVPRKKRQRPFPLTSSLLMLSGASIIGWVAWPIISFELLLAPSYTSLIRPVPDKTVAHALDNRYTRLLGESTIDYTKASNWFPKRPQEKVTPGEITSYTLSIPKLGIKNAVAIVGGEDLDKSLIHYGGTVLPGEYGKAVIFGHSVLPAFFNPQNYLTIFSTLPTLEEGDEILVTADNVTYRYTVFDMKVVSPDDISVLEQKFDWSYLCLVTCVPPGTYFKRLNVCAKLEKI